MTGGETPTFETKIATPNYQFEGSISPSPNDVKRFIARLPSQKPNEIDVILLIPSTSTEATRWQESQKKLKAASCEAERLYKDKPNYWPPKDKKLNSWPQGDSARDLIAMRWSRAGTKALGGPSAAAEIRKVVRQHMDRSNAEVGELRWIDARTVMTMSNWYEGTVGAASFTYVLKKNAKGKWRVLTYYMNSIS